MTRVCVTGGLGFIGTHLCHALRERGHEVTCVDDLSGSHSRGSGLGAVPELRAAGVSVLHSDVARGELGTWLGEADATVHLAGLPGVRSRRTFPDFWEQNTVASARIAAAAAERGARLVLASTSSVYGDAVQLPTPEHAPACPLNPYALSKLAAENATLAAARAGADALVARLFTVFGPGQRPDMAFAGWIERILRDDPILWCAHASARREFTYVDDAVRGLVAVLEQGRAGHAYNIAGTGSRPVAEALAEIEELLARTARVRTADASASEIVVTEACGRKAADELGYRPRVSLREGIELQVEAALELRRGVPAAALAG